MIYSVLIPINYNEMNSDHNITVCHTIVNEACHIIVIVQLHVCIITMYIIVYSIHIDV